MIAAISIFLPAVLLVATRELLNKKHHSKMYIFIEYLISVLIINFVAIGFAVIFLNYNYDIIDYLTQNCSFAFKYMALTMSIAVVGPALEYFLLSGGKLKVSYIPIFQDKRKVLNLLLYLYIFFLLLCNVIRAVDNVFWSDEVYSINMAKMTFSQMITTTASDVHPPLYYILLQVFYHIFGNFGWVYHSATLFTYAILLIVSITWLKRKFGIGATTLFITFASFLYNAMEFNLEVRMYSMAELFVLLSFFMLYLILTEQKTYWYTLFVLFSLAAAYTHYYALLSVAYFYIALLLYTLYQKMRKELWKVLAAYLVTILGYLPWVFTFLSTWKRTTGDWWMSGVPTWKQCLEFLFSGRLSNVLWVVLAAVSIIYVAKKISLIQVKRSENNWNIAINGAGIRHIDGEMAWILSGIFAIIGTIAVGIAASVIFRPVFQVKYLLPVSVVAWLLLAVVCSKLKFHKIWLTILILIMLVTGIPQFIMFYQFEEDLDKSTKMTLETVSGLGEDPYILYSAYMLDYLDYYYPDIERSSLTSVQDLGKYTNQNILLFWSEMLDDNTVKSLKAEGIDLVFVREGYLGTAYSYIYHVVAK